MTTQMVDHGLEPDDVTQDKLDDILLAHQKTNASLDVLKANAIKTNKNLDGIADRLDHVIKLLEIIAGKP